MVIGLFQNIKVFKTTMKNFLIKTFDISGHSSFSKDVHGASKSSFRKRVCKTEEFPFNRFFPSGGKISYFSNFSHFYTNEFRAVSLITFE